MCVEMQRAVKPVPARNRITGPKEFALAKLQKYIPGTDDSKFDDSAGIFSSCWIRDLRS